MNTQGSSRNPELWDGIPLGFGLAARRLRSVAVLGHSNIQTAMRVRQSVACLLCHVAAPGDGRTPAARRVRRDAAAAGVVLS